jgi:hypothetical protein
MSYDLIGKTVEFTPTGRASGTILRGEVVGFAPRGTTNRQECERLFRERPDLRFSRRHLRFSLDSASTYRIFVMVEQTSVYSKPIFHLYATNVLGVVPV